MKDKKLRVYRMLYVPLHGDFGEVGDHILHTKPVRYD
jgi:hypothetical protein